MPIRNGLIGRARAHQRNRPNPGTNRAGRLIAYFPFRQGRRRSFSVPTLLPPKAPITPPIIAPGTVPAIAPSGPAAIPNFAPAAAPVPAPAMSPTAVHFSSDVHIVQSSGLIRPPPCRTWNHPRRPPSEGQDGIEHAKSGTAREAACTPPYGADVHRAQPHAHPGPRSTPYGTPGRPRSRKRLRPCLRPRPSCRVAPRSRLYAALWDGRAPGAPPHTPASERRPNRSPSLTPPRARKHCSKGRTSGPRIRPEPP